MTDDERNIRSIADAYQDWRSTLTSTPPDAALRAICKAYLALLAKEAATEKVFEAGWDAGFQEAMQPDLFTGENRCAVAYQAWLNQRITAPEAQT